MQKAQYFRIYTDDQGESHIKELDVALAPVDFAPPAPPMNVAEFLPANRTYWVAAPAGWSGEEPHPTPRRQIFCIVQGACDVTVSDGTTRHFPTGTVVLLEDTWGKGHATRLIDGAPMLMLGIALADS